MSQFIKGERIVWQYRHHFNRHSSALRVKYGIFDHDHKEKGIKTGLCVVKFDGNKTFSTVPSSELNRVKAVKT